MTPKHTNYSLVTSMFMTEDKLLLGVSSLVGRIWRGSVQVFLLSKLTALKTDSKLVLPIFHHAVDCTIASVVLYEDMNKHHGTGGGVMRIFVALHDGSCLMIEPPKRPSSTPSPPNQSDTTSIEETTSNEEATEPSDADVPVRVFTHRIPCPGGGVTLRRVLLNPVLAPEKCGDSKCTSWLVSQHMVDSLRSTPPDLIAVDSEGQASIWDVQQYASSPICHWQMYSGLPGASLGSAAASLNLDVVWDVRPAPTKQPINCWERKSLERQKEYGDNLKAESAPEDEENNEEETNDPQPYVSPLGQARERMWIVTALGDELALWSRGHETFVKAKRLQLHRNVLDGHVDYSAVVNLQQWGYLATGDISGNVSFFRTLNIAEGPRFIAPYEVSVPESEASCSRQVKFFATNAELLFVLHESNRLQVFDLKFLKEVPEEGEDEPVILEKVSSTCLLTGHEDLVVGFEIENSGRNAEDVVFLFTVGREGSLMHHRWVKSKAELLTEKISISLASL